MTKAEKKDFERYFNKYKDNFTDDEIVAGYCHGWTPRKDEGAGDMYGEAELINDEETMDFITALDNLARELRRAA